MAQDIDLSSSSPSRQVLEEAPQRAPKFPPVAVVNGAPATVANGAAAASASN